MLAMARLMHLYKARLAALVERRKCLLQMQEASAPDSAASADVLAELERLQREYCFVTLAFPNALYSRIMEPWQVRMRPPCMCITPHASESQRTRPLESVCTHMQTHASALRAGGAAVIVHEPLQSCHLPLFVAQLPALQACSVWVASHPYVPSLMVLDQALQSLLVATGTRVPVEPPGGASGQQRHRAPEAGVGAGTVNSSSY